MHANVRRDVPGVPAPQWYDGEIRQLGWTPYGAALADGLIAVVGDVVTHRTGTTWDIEQGDPGVVGYRQPTLKDYPVPPWQQVLVQLHRMDRGQGPIGLTNTVEHSLRDLPARRDPGGEPVEGEVLPSSHPAWDFELHLSEEAAHGLTEEQQEVLGARLLGLPGVAEIVGEDRELILLRTERGVSADALQREVDRILADLWRPGND